VGESSQVVNDFPKLRFSDLGFGKNEWKARIIHNTVVGATDKIQSALERTVSGPAIIVFAPRFAGFPQLAISTVPLQFFLGFDDPLGLGPTSHVSLTRCEVFLCNSANSSQSEENHWKQGFCRRSRPFSSKRICNF